MDFGDDEPAVVPAAVGGGVGVHAAFAFFDEVGAGANWLEEEGGGGGGGKAEEKGRQKWYLNG